MRDFLWSVVYATCLLSNHALVRAQTVQSVVWKIPDGSAPDLSSSFQQGTTLPVTWNAWTDSQYLDGYKTLTDLWAYSWDKTVTVDGYLLKSNINITTGGTFNWNIAITDSDLAKTAKWVLEFKPHSTKTPPVFDSTTGEISSTGFIVLVADTVSSSTTASSTSTSATAASNTQTGTSTPTPIPTKKSSGLSTGAKAAIGVVIGVVVLAALAVALFLFMRKRGKRDVAPPHYESGNEIKAGAAGGYYDPVKNQEVKPQPYSDQAYPTELAETEVRTPVEMPATRY